MRGQHGRRAQRNPADKRRVSGHCQPVDAQSAGLHFHGPLEYLPADRGEAGGSRQAIDEPHVKHAASSAASRTTDRRMVHLQAARRTRKRPALRHGQEMPDIFPIDHLCGFSRITQHICRIPHRAHRPISRPSTFPIAALAVLPSNGEVNAAQRRTEHNVRTTLRSRIVGVEPGRSWAARGHIPALRALPETFEIIGIANTSLASAETAVVATGLPRAFADVARTSCGPRSPHCYRRGEGATSFGDREGGDRRGEAPRLLRMAAWQWSGRSEEMTALAQAKGVLGVVGTQAQVAPEIEYLRHLIADGFVGDVLSTTLVARGGALQGGGSIPDKKNGPICSIVPMAPRC